MKFLFDLFPVILFFVAFKFAEGHADASAAFATQWLGALVSGGVVGPKEAPILIATAVAIIATLGQVLYLKLRGRTVEKMLWISLAIIVVFGGATIWFHDETFIKWKPTILYWLFAGVLVGAQLFTGRNLIRAMMEQQMSLPEPIWTKVNWMWAGFFAAMGGLNLLVAFSFPTDVWVNFKLFGGMGLMFVFVILQGLWLGRHIKEEEA